MNTLLRWLLSSLALLAIARLLPGIELQGFYAALITILLLGLVNIFIRPVLVLLTLPINIVTLGLFTLVINGLLFWFIGSVVDGFSVNGFGAAFLGALLMSMFNWLITIIISKERT